MTTGNKQRDRFAQRRAPSNISLATKLVMRANLFRHAHTYAKIFRGDDDETSKEHCSRSKGKASSLSTTTTITMATRTRSRSRFENASRMEQLPVDVLVGVLEFSTLAERIQLGRCSKILLNTISKDFTLLWVEINLEGAVNLTDNMLEALLTRVNARSVTKNINLAGCSSLVDGNCLAPLRSSHVLERVNICTGCPLRVVNEFERDALKVLRTSIPFRLRSVKFSTVHALQDQDDRSFHALGDKLWYGSRGVFVRRESFISKMRAEQRKQALQDKIACQSCGQFVCEENEQVIPRLVGLPSSQCIGECGKYYCCKPNCPEEMLDCRFCGDACCQSCDMIGRCMDCSCASCVQCGPTFSCDACSETFCFSCQAKESCGGCDRVVCGGCFAEEELEREYVCSKCTEWLCSQCESNLATCLECNFNFCLNCIGTYICDCCQASDGWFTCSDCKPVTPCGQCGMRVCSPVRDCEACDKKSLCKGCVWSCAGCSKPRCDPCARSDGTMDQCRNCRKVYCSDCWSADSCDVCKKSIWCKKCVLPLYTPPLYCMVCNKYSETTCYCATCLHERVSPSKVIPGISHGTCSSCLGEKRPAKKARHS